MNVNDDPNGVAVSVMAGSNHPDSKQPHDPSTKWGLVIKGTEDRGRGVFAGVDIPARELVVLFQGPIFDKDTCPDFSEALQVGVNAWMWSSGGVDDIVNHSCDPNTGLWQEGGHTYLMSLRPIAAGEELFFDYSTSMVDEPWDMQCLCGTAACRGVIGNFLDMPQGVRDRYARAGVLPEHVWTIAQERAVALPAPDAGCTGGAVAVPRSQQ